jgi:hypothetical protein
MGLLIQLPCLSSKGTEVSKMPGNLCQQALYDVEPFLIE